MATEPVPSGQAIRGLTISLSHFPGAGGHLGPH